MGGRLDEVAPSGDAGDVEILALLHVLPLSDELSGEVEQTDRNSLFAEVPAEGCGSRVRVGVRGTWTVSRLVDAHVVTFIARLFPLGDDDVV